MNWKARAAILKVLSSGNSGFKLYQFLQRHFGDFCNTESIFKRIEEQVDLINFAGRHGATVKGAAVLEIGTGWVPLAPIVFAFFGAGSIISADINKYYIPGLLRKAVNRLVQNKDILVEQFTGSIPADDIERGVGLLCRFKDSPESLLEKMNIQLLSPIDAGAMSFKDNQFDIFFSIDTLEHICRNDIISITGEAGRIIRPGGACLHLIDSADHFSYTDKKIPMINFLQYPTKTWSRYCNAFTYHNRLRGSDYNDIFLMSSFDIEGHEFTIDDESLRLLRSGFRIDDEFSRYDYRELSKIKLKYHLKKR